MASLLLPLNKPTLLDPSRPLSKARSGPPSSIRCSASSSSQAPSSVIQQTHTPINPLTKVLIQPHDDDVDFSEVEAMSDEEDPRALRDIWREIQGSRDWEGMLGPTMNSHLRREIIRYGEFAQACYDSFDFDPNSKYCGSCKYLANHFFENMDMSSYGYHMCRYLYATSNINLPNFFQKSSIRSIWSPHANWMGYVAVASDEAEIKRLGRRDIVISWRGTVTYLEWIHDLKNILCPAHFRDNPHVQIESGFYDLYTTKEDNCRYCSFSARQQVLAEVKRLVERYKGEPLSITVTGHSLGAALAMLTAYDIAEMRLNVVRDDDGLKKIPLSVFSFASPRVGNLRFKERCDQLGVKTIEPNIGNKQTTSKRLAISDFGPVISRITHRVQSWAARNLSYAGRLELLNSVIFGIQAYWANVFLLPNAVIEKIESIMRSFLWSGKEQSRRSLVAWDTVCRPKEEGGVGFKELLSWNKAAISRAIFEITNASQSLWKQWITVHILKGADFWNYNNPHNGSSCWRKIIQIRDELLDLEDSAGILNHMTSPNGKYSTKGIYNLIRGRAIQLDWCKPIWGGLNAPRCSFISWLAGHKRLPTLSRLMSWNLASTDTCVLCDANHETNDHLWDDCSFTNSVLNSVMRWLRINTRQNSLHGWLNWLGDCNNTCSFRYQISCAAFTGFIYHSWQARNNKIFKGQNLDAATCALQVINHAKQQAFVNWRKNNRESRSWCNTLGITIGS